MAVSLGAYFGEEDVDLALVTARRVDPALDRLDAAGRVRAAGGLVWRVGKAGSVELVLVHRPAHGDWSLPKGKRHRGETDERCAVREVEEETGLRCVPGHELPATPYIDRSGRPKLVRYWEMTVASGSARAQNEVDDVRWLGLPAAADMMTYRRDHPVLAAFARFAGR